MPLGGLSTLAVMKFALVTTVAIGTSGAILAWRERPEPGSIPLAALMVGQVWWSVTLFSRLNATGVVEKLLWIDISWAGIVIIPIAWLFFALEYTGYNQYVRPRYVAAVSVVPIVTALLGATSPLHNLLYLDSTLVEQNGAVTLSRTPGIWFWVAAAYTYLIGLIGTVPLLQFITSDVNTFKGQSLAILIGVFAPAVANGLFLLGVLPTGGVDPTPVAFSVTGVCFLGALTRFKLFGTSPAPIRPARRSVFKRMEEGAVVLDRHDHVVDINRQAAAAAGVRPDEVLGRSIEVVMPDLDGVVDSRTGRGRAMYRPDDGTKAYDVSISRLTDIHRRTTGQIITLHDITDHLRQQQRLEVLNRVFRHNIRTSTQVIVGNADYLATHNSEESATKVQENARNIEEISDKIRTVLDVFEQGRKQTRAVRLGAILEKCIDVAGTEYPEVTIEAGLPDETVHVNGILEDVFRHVIDNAASHNTNQDPRVWVDVDAEGKYVEVSVSDNGPGINDEELALVEQGTETPLEHGTGIGLALIAWGTEIAGGSVTFDENESMGVTVTVKAPLLSSPESQSGESAHAEVKGHTENGPLQSLYTLSLHLR